MMETCQQLGHIGVLMGGPSSEREISLKSGRAVVEALKQAGCQVTAVDITSSDEKVIAETIRSSGIAVAFIALHGRLGEDGIIQSILERLKIPYTGSGVKTNQITISKIATQKLLKKHGIPVPAHVVITKGETFDTDKLIAALHGLPVVVKPETEGSSIGISLVKNIEDLQPALAQAWGYGPNILVEQYIAGRELTVGVLADQALAVIEIRPKEKFFDFTAKYQKGLTEYLVPAPIPESVRDSIQELALKTYTAVGCRHLARIDFMLDEKMEPYVLEINTIPGFTETSLLPKAARAGGIDFANLCIQLVKMAYGKKI